MVLFAVSGIHWGSWVLVHLQWIQAHWSLLHLQASPCLHFSHLTHVALHLCVWFRHPTHLPSSELCWPLVPKHLCDRPCPPQHSSGTTSSVILCWLLRPETPSGSWARHLRASLWPSGWPLSTWPLTEALPRLIGLESVFSLRSWNSCTWKSRINLIRTWHQECRRHLHWLPLGCRRPQWSWQEVMTTGMLEGGDRGAWRCRDSGWNWVGRGVHGKGRSPPHWEGEDPFSFCLTRREGSGHVTLLRAVFTGQLACRQRSASVWRPGGDLNQAWRLQLSCWVALGD